MRDAVRTGDRQMGVPEHLVGRVVVRTGVEVDVGLECRDRAVVGRPQADADTAPVPLVMADDRFLPGPPAVDRAVLTALGEAHRGQPRAIWIDMSSLPPNAPPIAR